MNKQHKLESDMLTWVKNELNAVLSQASRSLEHYVESDNDPGHLVEVKEALLQVGGTLQMVELYGAAMLVTEAVELIQALADGSAKNLDDALEVLLRTMLQLPDYLEHIEAGNHDIPIVLLPLMNDLRAARNAELLTEKVLFLPELDSAQLPETLIYPDRQSGHDAQSLAKKLRHIFELGLLGWFRNKDVKANLNKLKGVTDRLQQTAMHDASKRLWWTTSALIEALAFEGLETSVAVKSLLGRIDREIKHLIDQDESAFADSIPDELVKNILYYVARAANKGDCVNEVKKAFSLREYLPQESDLDELRDRISGLNTELFSTVSVSIHEDLAEVKDKLEIFVNSKDKNVDQLDSLITKLNGIADTLGMLELDESREKVQEEVEIVRKVVTGEVDATETAIMNMARVMLVVEKSIDNFIASGAASYTNVEDLEAARAPGTDAIQDLPGAEYRKLLDSVLSEALRDMQKAKEAIIDYIASPKESNQLENVPDYFNSIKGALSVAHIDSIPPLLNSISRYVASCINNSSSVPKLDELETLADAITSVEYYMEALGSRSQDPLPILEAGKASVAKLGFPVEGQTGDQLTVEDPEVEHSDPLEVEGEETQIYPLSDASDVSVDPVCIDQIQDGTPKASTELSPQAPPGSTGDFSEQFRGLEVLSGDVDEEIIEIFLEEADEEVENITQLLPQWRRNTNDESSLATMRRSFHTLKGSGRLVGAQILGEFAWAFEQLLNRVTDGAIVAAEPHFESLQQAVNVLPQLVRQIKGEGEPESDYLAVMARAHALSTPNERTQGETVKKKAEKSISDISVESSTPHGGDINLGFATNAQSIEVTGETETSFGSGSEEDIETFSPEDGATKHTSQIAQGTSNTEAEVSASEIEPSKAEQVTPLEAETQAGLIGQEQSIAVKSGPNPRIDPVLLEIFTAEANQHLNTIVPLLNSSETQESHLPVTEELLRAIHTLNGSSRSADIPEIASICGPLEKYVSELKECDHPIPSQNLPIFRHAVAGVHEGLESLHDQTKPMPDHSALLSEIETMVESESVAQVPPATSVPATIEATEQDEESLGQVDAVEHVGTQELAAIVEVQDTSMSTDELRGDLPNEDDREVVEIFLEEAVDLLDASDAALRRWSDCPDDQETVKELQRLLHTLKGGARMAGHTNIGDLSHALESLIIAVVDGRVSSGDGLFDHLYRPLDSLQEMIELAGRWQPVYPAPELIEDLDRLRQGHKSGAKLELNSDSPDKPRDAAASKNAEAKKEVVPLTTQDLGNSPAELQPDRPSEHEPELVEIFLEEASDIMQAVDNSLQSWNNNTENNDSVTELQRQLHTLKGGARMAGFTSIGDLSHALESLIIAIVDGSVSTSQGLFEHLYQSFDRLQMMLERASSSQPVYPTPDLIETLSQLRQGKLVNNELSSAALQPSRSDECSAGFSPNPDDLIEKPALDFDARTMVAHALNVDAKASTEVVRGQPTSQTEQADSTAEPERRTGPEVGNKPAAAESKRQVNVKTDRVQAEKPRVAGPQELIRVPSDLLDTLVNNAGEVNIYHSRLEQQVNAFGFNLNELEQTVERLRDQLRKLEMETEVQILFQYEQEKDKHDEEFDPLELDRYSTMQQLSRALSESVNDLVSIKEILVDLVKDSETLLLQKSRISTDLQEGLMRTRMVQFTGLAPRLRRIVRQTSKELGKKVDLHISGETNELDRSVLERMIAPLEHMLRNAIAHGVESPDQRCAAGKPVDGTIRVGVTREGAEIVVRVEDDGGGIDLDAVREKARRQGLISGDEKLSSHDIMQFILESGFSTAKQVTQISGRGVGMDVVNSEIKQLGGVLSIGSTHGKGTEFTVRLPFTLAINQALLVQAGEDLYAVPLASIEGIVRLTIEELKTLYAQKKPSYEYAANEYELKHLGALLGKSQPILNDPHVMYPVLLIRSGDQRVAMQIEGLMGSREVVVKPVGPQISKLRGISGATILGDGRVVLILDVAGLVRMGAGVRVVYSSDELSNDEPREEAVTVMVVDDSITIRKVTSRMLERHNFAVMTAKDGIDAVSQLQDRTPDLMLLDIEMPRMDGYELATHVRNNDQLKNIPIIMITSRTGDKHRKRALKIGVNKYLGKPYQEKDLLENISDVLQEVGGHDTAAITLS